MRGNYSRDQRPEEWGSAVILRGNNFEPPMSQTGQERPNAAIDCESASPPEADISLRRIK
jgi:hypothetical protein